MKNISLGSKYSRAKSIKDIHNIQGKPHDYMVNKNITGVWKNIVAAKKELNSHDLEIDDLFKIVLKSGENTHSGAISGWVRLL